MTTRDVRHRLHLGAGRWSPTQPPGRRSAIRHARELARLAPFAQCTPRELRQVARWGDLIKVEPGHVIVQRDHADWWLFVVVSGRVALTGANGSSAELHPGDHFGETALVGLRPQPATATAIEPSVLFVLGPRYALTLLSTSERFRRVVLPHIAAHGYPRYAKEMYDVGQREWQPLRGTAPVHDFTAPTRPLPLPLPTGDRPRGFLDIATAPASERLPGRPLSLREAVQALGELPPAPPRPGEPMRTRLRRRWWVAVGVIASGLLGGLSFGYHPPRLVLSGGRPIDVVADITVTGAPTYAPRAHYLLLWVDARQPTLGGLLVAFAEGRRTVGFDSGDAASRTAARAQFLDSQHTAIRLAVQAAGLDPNRVQINIRDRGFSGPSAALAYALALDDLLTPGDAARAGRVAATGALLPDGSVQPVGWPDLKARSAATAGATLLIVPAAEAPAATGWVRTTCGVTSLRAALADVRASRCR